MLLVDLLVFSESHPQPGVVLLLKTVSVVDLEDDVSVAVFQLEPDIWREDGGRGILSPGIHDLARTTTRGVVLARPETK